MPELPEVETVRKGLERHVVGRTISAVQVLHPRAVRRHVAGSDDFAAAIGGRTVTGARRRGKYLWLPVAEHGVGEHGVAEDALLAHLGMSGQFLISDPGAPLSGSGSRSRIPARTCGSATSGRSVTWSWRPVGPSCPN